MSAYYPHEPGVFSKRAIVFIAIVVFHLVIIYAFVTGLAQSGARLINTILQTNIIQTQKEQVLPPPPPHVDLKLPPPVQVVAPEVTINIPITPPPITNVAPKRAPPAPVVVHVPPAPIVAAKITFSPDPADYYPEASRRNNEQGRALVHICIDTRGRVATAEVSATSGHPMLDDAAVKLAKATRFKPASQRGKAIEQCTGLPVKFVLTGG